MKIELLEITIGDLVDGYVDKDVEGGVVGYGGKLNIRPPYQREFVYNDKQRKDVINSVLNGFPLNVMYWVRRSDGGYEVLDGQQRTISIGQYKNGDFLVGDRYYNNQPDDVQERIMNYPLTIYICEGEHSEILDWFKIINIKGEQLTDQELRNAIYSGPWVSDAKRYFSKNGCPAYQIGHHYVDGSPIRQIYLEKTIKWISGGNIKEYMAAHQHDADAKELWKYFKAVVKWIETVFPQKRSIMQTVDWGTLYAKHRDSNLDPDALEQEISQLLSLKKRGQEGPIQRLPGIYPYVLDGDERHLNLRSFTEIQKNMAYEQQNGKCVYCGKEFEIGQMEGDHKKPWRKGGLTTDDNCQMLCRPCNRRKSSK